MAATYPADTFQESVDLTIEASNQLAQVVRGDANTEVTVADGSTIPSIRKAQTDSMYFKEPEAWVTGQTETDYLQLKKYINPTTGKESWWFAKSATVSNPVAMGTSPFGDDNWTLYTPEDLFISGKAEYESIYQALKGKAAEAGYNLVKGSFEEGGTLTNTNDVLWYQANGKYYNWYNGSAKTVVAGSSPTNIGTDWIDITNIVLRSKLASTDGAGLIGSMSYAQLRAYSGSQTTVNVWGISNVFDGAAGTFKVNASDTTSADNGGTILVDASGRRWYRVFYGAYNPVWFGADINGVSDSTSAIQKLSNAMGDGSWVHFPSGTYLLSATITWGNSVTITGDNPNSTKFYRTGDYGDTFYFANAGALRISGLWFSHSTTYTSGDTSLANKASYGAHLHIVKGQSMTIENTWCWRLTHGIWCDACTMVTIRKCWITGIWDPSLTACQEGVSCIYLDNTSGETQIVTINDNNLSGANVNRSVTYTANDGSKTLTQGVNVGSKYGVLITCCEELRVFGNIIGGQSYGQIYTLFNSNSVAIDWRIWGNMFDSGPIQEAPIKFNSAVNTIIATGVAIYGNTFNGEYGALHAIHALNVSTPNSPLLSNFTINDNDFMGYVGTPVIIYSATNGRISNNNFCGINQQNVSAGADPNFCAGVYLTGVAQLVEIEGNNIGGQTSTGLASGSYAYLGVANDSSFKAYNFIHDNTLIGYGGSGNQVGYVRDVPTILTGSSGNYQAIASDSVIITQRTDTVPWSIVLPSNVPLGHTLTIKDGNGRASTAPVVIGGTVDGVSDPAYSANYFVLRLIYNGASWNNI